jgi:DNA-binding SARP family transcriptional activator
MSVPTDGHVFRVLGPVQVLARDGPVMFARRQQLDLLALLLMHAGQVLTVDRIVDLMWGGAIPRTASTQIKNMVSALRSSLTDGSRLLAGLERHPAGYRLSIKDFDLDLSTFTRLVGEARSAEDPETVSRTLREALSLWHGDHALAGVRANFADAARAQLGEQRLAAQEALFDAELECGRHAEIVAELTDAVAAHPAREKLTGQLMTCLYRCGRPTDALSVYRKARQTLVEEYGLEPSARLRDLERLILQGDIALDTVATAAEPEPPTLLVPAQLPLQVRGFAGRASELARLNALVSNVDSTVAICAILGTAGVGKTALALHWAHKIAARFPDGQLYVNLRGFDPDGAAMTAGEAIRCFLDAFAIDPSRIPDGLPAQTALYRSLLAGRRMLVLLDNAVSAEQVRPLLPGTPGCLVVVTSRNRLSSLVSAEGAHPVTLDLLSYADARDLLIARLGPQRVGLEEPAAREIARLCARLPLALAMVAARAAIHPTFSLAALSAELATVLAGDGSAENVHSVFSWSYERLSPDAAGLFRALSVHPAAEFSATAAASLAGRPLPQTRRLLTELTYAHLLTEPAPGRFSTHDLLRGYALELSRSTDSSVSRAAAATRLTEHYLHTADAAALLLYPHRYQVGLVPPGTGVCAEPLTRHQEALHWFTIEHPTLVAMVELAASHKLAAHTWQLASTIASYLDRRGHWHDWASTQSTALATAQRFADPAGQAWAHSGLGLAHSRQRDFANAHQHLTSALELLSLLGDSIGQAYTHLRLTSVYDGWGNFTEALSHARQALELYRSEGHGAGHAQALNTIGWYHAQLGQSREAIVHCLQALALHRELGDNQGAAHTLDSLGYAYHQLGEYSQAASYYREAAVTLGESGDRYYEAIALTHLGDAHYAAGETLLARQAWKEGLHILQELDHEDAEKLAQKIRDLDN